MKKKHLLILIWAVGCFGHLAAKDFETILYRLDCSGFNTNATTDMEDAANPHNWTSAWGSQWTSEYCFAQDMTNDPSLPFIGKSVRWGGTGGSGSATTPALNLFAAPGEQIRLIISITAGSNKTGSMQIKLDEEEVGNIVATGFTGQYYTYEYILNGTSSSHLQFTHSKSETAGNLYVQEIKVIKEPVSLVKMDCSAVSASNKEMSDATGTYTWKTVFGEQIAANTTSTFCYAQNLTDINQSIRIGSSSNNGAFTISGLNLSVPLNTKLKLYFEALYASATVNNTLFTVTVDDSPTPTLSQDIKTGKTLKTWYEYEAEITNGTDNSTITFTGSVKDATTNTQFYIRNLRIYLAPTNFIIPANISRNYSEWNSDYTKLTFLSDENGTGQLIGISAESVQPALVEVKKTFNTNQWYPIGFPFEIASISIKQGENTYIGSVYDHDNGNVVVAGNPEHVSSATTDNIYLATYDGAADNFKFAGSLPVASAGYVIAIPAGTFNVSGTDDGSISVGEVEVTFTSIANPTLNSEGSISLADGYTLVANPNLINATSLSGASDYYQYNYGTPANFGRVNAASLSTALQPFEAIVAYKGNTSGTMRSALNIGGTDVVTALPVITKDAVVSTEYYNLQGVHVGTNNYLPLQSGIYIVKQIHASGKTSVNKSIIR